MMDSPSTSSSSSLASASSSSRASEASASLSLSKGRTCESANLEHNDIHHVSRQQRIPLRARSQLRRPQASVWSKKPSTPSAIFYHTFVLLLMSSFIVTSVSARGNCFNTKMGLSIEGGNYKRIKNIEVKECGDECLGDLSCLGYEWNQEEKVCYLKSRSTSGGLVSKKNSVVGFCEDYEDETRYRLQDHVIVGPAVAVMENVKNNDDCKAFCAKNNQKNFVTYYSWTPNELSMLVKQVVDVEQKVVAQNRGAEEAEAEEEEEEEEEEEIAVFGRCVCMDMMHEVRLEYDSFSGFVATPRRKHRRSLVYV